MLDLKAVGAGDIFLIHTKGLAAFPVPLAIRLITGGANHGGVITKVTKYGISITEAVFGGVNEWPLDKYLDSRKYYIEIHRVKSRAFKHPEKAVHYRRQAARNAEALLGSKYDALGALGVWGYLIKRRLFGGRARNSLDNRLRFFCFELVCTAYKLDTVVPNIFAGGRYPEARCSTITGRDIKKSKYTYLVTSNGD